VPFWCTRDGTRDKVKERYVRGMMPSMTYDEVRVQLAPKDTVLFHTDGLAEAHNAAGEMFGESRIKALIGRRPGGPGLSRLNLGPQCDGPTSMESYNANYIGGDINGGVQDLRQLYTRPTLRRPLYAMPVEGLYICSSSTTLGGPNSLYENTVPEWLRVAAVAVV